MDFIVITIMVIAVSIFIYLAVRRARWNGLVDRFGSEEYATRIMNKVIWQGMTNEMLIESRGNPDDIDKSVFKTKTRETWKYGKIGKNRYEERIMLENGIVVGWK